MVREIMRDEAFLAIPSQPATQEDFAVGMDLVDTLIVHSEECVGMAANMIGVSKRIIAFDTDDGIMLMFNPEILKKSEAFHTEEGCLSLEGQRPAKRYKRIKVQYQNEEFKTRIKTFTGWTAQIIQHEVDHCDGIII